jgi:hypothetical protein
LFIVGRLAGRQSAEVFDQGLSIGKAVGPKMQAHARLKDLLGAARSDRE